MASAEQNSAEREAEKILKDAYAEARAEECPQGDDCPVHFRVDDEYYDEEQQYARLITYHGEYVVVTEDNHELDNPAVFLKLLLGGLAVRPSRYETLVYHVGEGTIGDLSEKDVEHRRNSVRYSKKHDSYKDVHDEHTVVVIELAEGLIDVSKPLEL
jgi:hypothetical protein